MRLALKFDKGQDIKTGLLLSEIPDERQRGIVTGIMMDETEDIPGESFLDEFILGAIRKKRVKRSRSRCRSTPSISPS